MKRLRTIKAKLNSGEEKDVIIGRPKTKKELEEMYRFRNHAYVEKRYIGKNIHANGLDFDEYDEEKKCTYFIAKVDNKIIGTVRSIKDNYLPTEKEFFDFDEPEEMKKIPRENRAEIGRLIVSRYNEHNHFSKHVIMMGMLSEVILHFEETGIQSGYCYIKDKLRKKLKTINAPFHVIKKFKQKYTGEVMRGYFDNPKDIVYPMYFTTKELGVYSNFIFGKLFLKTGEREFKTKNNQNFFQKLLFFVSLKMK